MAENVQSAATEIDDSFGAKRIDILGVEYLHLQLDDGSELYVTEYGIPFARQLLPENYWTDKQWFAEHSVKLPGTSTLFRIETKPLNGRSRFIVLKWNRMGQDIPGETQAWELSGTEFNSPFEEFALLMELRAASRGVQGRLLTHKPLAIYVPKKFVEADRMGRRPYKIEAMQKRHGGEITLHLNRQYAVIYEWIKGLDSMLAMGRAMISEGGVRELLAASDREMAERGFQVTDSKAHHIIIRPTRTGALTTNRRGGILYALVDFELLQRTPQHESEVRASKRKSYLFRQAHRFESREQIPPTLASTRIMGVDYIMGHVESTGGMLWVVGKDPTLFEYFLPEKWRRTPRIELSPWGRVYQTTTKDNIRLVWRVSKVGTRPVIEPPVTDEARLLSHGYNSPFEEVALSIDLARKGFETTYPRAIYATGHKPEVPESLVDDSRYDSHETLVMDDGHPVLGPNHDYITIWGFWNGPDELLATKDEDYCRCIDAQHALDEGLITRDIYDQVLAGAAKRLATAGLEDLNLRGSHLLLSLVRPGRFVTGSHGLPAARLCNYELLARTS